LLAQPNKRLEPTAPTRYNSRLISIRSDLVEDAAAQPLTVIPEIGNDEDARREK
jgi:hypothetical protein